MGAQKLNKKEVELIKHLLQNKGWGHQTISDFIGKVSRVQIGRIDKEKRWKDVPCPASERGQMLYYIYLNEETLE